MPNLAQVLAPSILISSKGTCEKHSHLEEINNEVEGK